jgi:hypothetical protein
MTNGSVVAKHTHKYIQLEKELTHKRYRHVNFKNNVHHIGVLNR